jgi:DNA-binding protein YbaB
MAYRQWTGNARAVAMRTCRRLRGRSDTVDHPEPSAMLGLLRDLNQTISNMASTQRQMLSLTGTAWSDDRMIKAVVGPRGQLVELEIDPRVYRKPNSKALAASIVSTVRAAVEDVVSKSQELMDQTMPQARDFIRPGAVPGVDMRQVMRAHDGDLKKMLEEGDDVELH